MKTPQITLTVHLVDGEFRAITAADENGAPYDVTISFAPQRVEETAEVTEAHKHKPPEPGRYCCPDDGGALCRYVAAAPPCPPGSHETKVVLKNHQSE